MTRDNWIASPRRSPRYHGGMATKSTPAGLSDDEVDAKLTRLLDENPGLRQGDRLLLHSAAAAGIGALAPGADHLLRR